MVSGGGETIHGVQGDPVIGPIVMFGLGDIFVEVLKDVTFRAAPFDEDEARAMIESLAAYPLLTGLRGQPPADLDALATAPSRLSLFAAANAIESLDINPFSSAPTASPSTPSSSPAPRTRDPPPSTNPAATPGAGPRLRGRYPAEHGHPPQLCRRPLFSATPTPRQIQERPAEFAPRTIDERSGRTRACIESGTAATCLRDHPIARSSDAK